MAIKAMPGGYLVLNNKWKNGDEVTLKLPMEIKVRQWDQNKNSVSVNYGPLTFSLKIAENYQKIDAKANVEGDSGWQVTADQTKWPAYNIYPASAWNYGLLLNVDNPAASFTVYEKQWPANDNPFTNANAPIELKVNAKQIPGWTVDQYGLCSVLPQSPVQTISPATMVTLVPMGGARLRISAFPVVK